MMKLLKTLFLMIIVGLVVAGVASIMSKKRLESKSDDEIREFLARKLDGKVGEEQLTTIQDAVIGGIRGKSSGVDADSEAIDEVADEVVVDTAGDEVAGSSDDGAADDDADEPSEEVSAG